MKYQMKSLSLLVTLIIVFITYSCNSTNKDTSTQAYSTQKASIQNVSECSPGAVFIIQCVGQNKIRITAIGTFNNASLADTRYSNHFSLVDVFKPNLSISIYTANSTGVFENTDGNNTVEFRGAASLTQSNGGSLDSYDILFRSFEKKSLLPGNQIAGIVELNLAGTGIPTGAVIFDVMNGCNSRGIVQWGLPGTPANDCLGEWIFLCDSCQNQ